MADALIPNEVADVLNTSFMGFKVWHILILSLIVPSPFAFVILMIMLVPGFKEKVTETIRNGFPRVYSGTAAGYGEGAQVSAASSA
jgi:hypothetical protein